VVNSFVLHAREPILIDTGLGVDEKEFIRVLSSVLDPADLRWIWLTHDDSDHMGGLPAVLEVAPRARLVTHAFAALRMSASWPVPLNRVWAVRPGDRLDVGDRELVAVRPPTFDSPMSIGIFDDRTATLFSVDAFGAILPATSEDLTDFSKDELVGGMVGWATFDSPWTHISDQALFGKTLDDVRRLGPERILSGHLPVAVGRTDELLDIIASVPNATPFLAPDAAAFEGIVAQLAT